MSVQLDGHQRARCLCNRKASNHEKELKNYEEKTVRICTLRYYGSHDGCARICGRAPRNQSKG